MDYLILEFTWTLWVLLSLALLADDFRLLCLLRPALKAAPPPADDTPPLSVLVCAHNERENLEQNLPLLLLQEYPSYELWVGLDHCEDDSYELLHRWQKRFPHLKILERQEGTPSKKAMQAQLVAAAQHDRLVFTDADCRPASPCWLQAHGAALASAALVLGYAPLQGQRLARWETAQVGALYLAHALRQMPYMGVGRNMSVQRSLYRPEKLKPELRSGDDDLLVNSIQEGGAPRQTAVLLSEESFCHSQAPISFAAWWRQKRRHHTTSLHYPASKRRYLFARGAGQWLFYVLGAGLLLREPACFLPVFLLRYLLTVFLYAPWHIRTGTVKEGLSFPVWECIWAIAVSGMHLANLLSPQKNKW